MHDYIRWLWCVGGRGTARSGRVCALALAWAMLLAGIELAVAQAPPAVVATPASGGDAAEALPAVQQRQCVTKDRVVVHFSYWPSARGKDAVPIILLHGWSGKLGAGNRQDVAPLAEALQHLGYAVLAPDLRGHGQSTSRKLDEQTVRTLDRESFRSQDINDMLLDLEAVRSFLVEENNAQRLNLESLAVVGFDMSTVVALNWVYFDWTMPSYPALKQGQDVKAFVLVSPMQSYRGLSTKLPLAHDIVRGKLSACIIYGREAHDAPAAKRMAATFKRSHRPTPTNVEDARRFQDLFIHEVPTSLEGTSLLLSPTLEVDQKIIEFLQQRLEASITERPWRSRTLTTPP